MITEKRYLKAKKLIADYETEHCAKWFVSGSLPTDEDIVRWSNKVADLTDDQKKYTATGSRIAIQERCAGARWMLNKLKGQ